MTETRQPDLFETYEARSLLSRLFEDSRLYVQSQDYKDLLDFVVRLRNFAPFNAMLLQVQKPGLTFAASKYDWRHRFGRWPKEDARPLLILWLFGPVALVYDVMDTEGQELPTGTETFPARGEIGKDQLARMDRKLAAKNIKWIPIDTGDARAGSIRRVKQSPNNKKQPHFYEVRINSNHQNPIQFATLAHELGHLFLGHLGPDEALKIANEPWVDHAQQELEAESVAYMVCKRNGVVSRSEKYLSTYVTEHDAIDRVDLYRVMRSAGRVETLLGLTEKMKFE